MLCVTTRFRLSTPFALLPMYLAFRRMRRDLDAATGLVRHAFLIQSPVAVYTLSLWASREAMERFTNVPSHVAAVRYAKRSCRGVWSAYWELDAVSRYASEWEGSVAWPTLVPDAAQPWRMVPAGPGSSADRPGSAEGTAAAFAARRAPADPAARSTWDWSRVLSEEEAPARR